MKEALVSKYQPRTLDDFAGLTVPITLMRKLIASPWESAWIFAGQPGSGKTTLALAVAAELKAELHHIPAKACDLEMVTRVYEKCHYVPFVGEWHVVLTDEIDKATEGAQLAFLSKLDAAAPVAKTIYFFTSNEIHNLEPRFVSRCRVLNFSDDGLEKPAIAMMRRIWKREASGPEPDFAQLLRQNEMNIRGALNDLELEMLCPGAGIRAISHKENAVAIDKAKRQTAAKKAWVTMRKRKDLQGKVA